MLVVRGTKKLRGRVRAPAAAVGDTSTTILGDWFANALFWKPQVALLVNERTLLPLYMPLAPAATLLDRVPDAIASLLRRHGVDDEAIASELAAMADTRIAPTDNRSVVGVMNEFAAHGELVLGRHVHDLEDLSLWMSEMILRPLEKGAGSPDRELAAVLGAGGPHQLPSNVIQFPGTYRPEPEPEVDAEVDAETKAERAQPGSGRPAPGEPEPGQVRVYQLKITLQGIKPPVWRRVLVDATSSLDHVHEVIQAAFGWWSYHLHEFEIGGTRYGVPDPDDHWDVPNVDEGFIRLDAVAEAGSSFTYLYDFGDGWDHRVVVEKVLTVPIDTPLPSCIGGRRACPPEDCGGPWGYRDLLAILADPAHPERRQRAEWVGRPFDPEAFDPAEFAHNLRAGRLAALDD
jgi:hypothetical protein